MPENCNRYNFDEFKFFKYHCQGEEDTSSFPMSVPTSVGRGLLSPLLQKGPRRVRTYTEITPIQNPADVFSWITAVRLKGRQSRIKKIDRIVYAKTSDAIYCSCHEVQREPRCFHPALPFNWTTCLYLPLPFPIYFLHFLLSFFSLSFLNFVAFYLLVLVLPQARNIAWSISLRVNVQI